MKRFVILHHRVADGLSRTNASHFDWMFETGAVLRTFASPIINAWHIPFEQVATRLPDHRIEYLTLEGQIPPKTSQVDRGEMDMAPRDRGSVQQVAVGHYETLQDLPDRFEVQLVMASPDTQAVHLLFEQMNSATAPRPPAEDERWSIHYSPS